MDLRHAPQATPKNARTNLSRPTWLETGQHGG